MRSLFMDRRFRVPRVWSNDLLRRIAPLFDGHVINVSGWRDEDKRGGHYRDYFANARSYSISNYGGYMGEADDTAWTIDLEGEIPDELKGRFDVVFNHTTLEHVFDVFTATRNLCALSSDVVIVVVPFIQEQHTSQDFSDYWRFTPLGIKAMFAANGFDTVLLGSTPGRRSAIYHLAVASSQPQRWREALARIQVKVNDGTCFFVGPFHRLLRKVLGR